MRCLAAPLTAVLLFAAARPVRAAGSAPGLAPLDSALLEDISFLDRLVLDSGRIEYEPPDPAALHLAIHGEYQLRYQAESTLPLQAPVGQPRIDTLGQGQYLYHWLRIGARFDLRDRLTLVMQVDVPRGLITGDTTQWVGASRDALAQARWYDVFPRYLYLEYRSPIGVFRVGQQGAHWGMGLVANDGDHPTLFGDYRRGALVERVLYTVTPLGEGTPLYIALGGDVVFQDATADLIGGDRAFEAVAAIGYRAPTAEIGVYGVARRQERDAQAFDAYTSFVNGLTAGTLDATARFYVPVRQATVFAYGQIEVAGTVGSTSFVRGAFGNAVNPTAPRPEERILSYGGAVTLGVVGVMGEGKARFGRVAAELEVGYASGDANPADGVTKRFTFDENHHVGLVLFDQVLRWKTARSATLAGDPSLVARPAPGLELLPSNGGVFGAQYLNPRFVVRPRRWLDVKGGAVIAQTTADFVDPYHFGVLGNARNYDGGNAHGHDLGVELDAGVAGRVPLPSATLQAGVEGGVLFPGNAFDDAAGRHLPSQYLTRVQLGLQF